MLVRTRSLAVLTGAALTGVALVVGSLAAPAAAQPSGALVEGRAATGVATAGLGRGIEANVLAAPTADDEDRPADPPGPLPARGGEPLSMPASYPHQPELRVFPPDAADATELNGTVSHADLAPHLTRLMERSDRVSTQVVGRSTEGRDLYLVTVTAPERRSETARQTAWREEIRERPDEAMRNRELRADYKTPVWITANIHGDEWEGTDAALRVVERLATADDAATRSMLEHHRLVFSLTLNPDGRTHATRSTSLGLDANRDMITLATPEARSYVRTAQAVQPLFAGDFHGYTDVLQVEPAGPPHGENYEYDLFLPHAYAIARQVEDDVVTAGIEGNTYYDRDTGEVVARNTGSIKIPYRDTPSGWDDYPPVFSAQYALFHGAVSTTVELPLNPAGRTARADATVNTEVAATVMRSMIDYVHTSSDSMLADQAEMFRRGLAGAPKVALTAENIGAVPGPDEWKQLWDEADDQGAVRLPRAYVIPVGSGQRSASDAEDLVDALLFHGVEVERLAASTRVAGTTYPAGSYVVDLHQPLRGLANTLLALGSDVSDDVPAMYDVSAWSPAYLWGATVDRVGVTTDDPIGRTAPVRRAAPRGSVPDGARYVAFDVAGVADHRALNDLLGQGVTVRLTADGRAAVGPRGLGAARDVADRYGISFVTVSRAEYEAGERGEDLTVAYAGNQDDRLSLLALGFDDLVPVSATQIEAGAADGGTTGLEDADVLWVGSSLDLRAGSAGHAYVLAWLHDDDGAIVGRGAGAFAAAASYGLVSGTARTGDPASNGIIATSTPGEVLDDHAQDHGFVYPAVWFTDLGEETSAELTYGSLRAGYWPLTREPDGRGSVIGQAAAVSGKVGHARAFVFGTSVFFRTHPRGGLSQAATAIHWAAR